MSASPSMIGRNVAAGSTEKMSPRGWKGSVQQKMPKITMQPDRPNREEIISLLTNGARCFCTPEAYAVEGAYPSQVDPKKTNISLMSDDHSESLRVQVDQAQRDTWFKDGMRYRVFLIEEEGHDQEEAEDTVEHTN